MLALCVKVRARFLRRYLVWIQMRLMEADANEGGSDVRSLVNPVVSPAGSMGGGGYFIPDGRWTPARLPAGVDHFICFYILS